MEVSYPCFYRRICSYHNCAKSQKIPKGRFFRFPLNKELAEQWVVNCGNASLLTIPTSQLQKRYICEDHFPQHAIIDNRLICGTVPVSYKSEDGDPLGEDVTIFLDCPSSTRKQIYDEHINIEAYLRCESPEVKPEPVVIIDNPLINTDAYEDTTSSVGGDSASLTEENAMLNVRTKKFTKLRKKTNVEMKELPLNSSDNAKRTDSESLAEENAILKAEVNRLSKQILQMKELGSNPKSKKARKTFISHGAKTLANMQVWKQNKIWTKSEMDTALAIYKASPAAYLKMKRLRIGLPRLKYVKMWIAGTSGILKESKRRKLNTIKYEDTIEIGDEMIIKNESKEIIAPITYPAKNKTAKILNFQLCKAPVLH